MLLSFFCAHARSFLNSLDSFELYWTNPLLNSLSNSVTLSRTVTSKLLNSNSITFSRSNFCSFSFVQASTLPTPVLRFWCVAWCWSTFWIGTFGKSNKGRSKDSRNHCKCILIYLFFLSPQKKSKWMNNKKGTDKRQRYWWVLNTSLWPVPWSIQYIRCINTNIPRSAWKRGFVHFTNMHSM